ncbi:MAG: hypothetical protein KH972_02555 [Peptostreptococcaceae bacterium]|nr:hypothetical protein [Peptostreptococcaceae bacterium]
MQKVSKEYKKSMKSSLRERAYIKLSFGLINQEAQAKSTIENKNFSYYSNLSSLLSEGADKLTYATLEENITKVDGSMYFLPRHNTGGYYNTGLISKDLITDKKCEVIINLNTIPTNFKGLTVDFGENYPVDFDVIGSTGQVFEFRNNDKQEWTTEKVIENTTIIKFIFHKMKNPNSRLRIYSITFGYGLIYTNESVIDSTLDNYVSPIGADIPQVDFSVTLKNYDRYFNVDNPNSAINYLETGQEMDIMYGYQLPNSTEIEWIQGNHLICSEWESDDNVAIIRCQDVFRNMNSEYNKGLYQDTPQTYYSLAEKLIQDMGVKKYYIDPRLKNLYTKNPIPRVKHKEALQIIANACRCSLSQSRFGEVEIKSNFMPEVKVSANDEASYSKVYNILKDKEKVEYSSFAKDYTKTDGTMYFIARNGIADLTTGYVSNELSNANGTFNKNPILTFKMGAIRAYHAIKFVFGHNIPKKFKIVSYKNSVLVNDYTINENEIDTTTVVLRFFDDCDEIKVEFLETKTPNNRITLNYFSLNDTADFTISRSDMLSSPKAIKQELVKEVIVPCYVYQRNNREENLIYEDVEITSGQIETYYIQDASYGYFVKLNEKTGLADVIDSGSYYVTIQYRVSGSYKLEIQGYRYRIVEKYAVEKLNIRGKTIKWKNPLIDNMEMATALAQWLKDYYKSGIEYEYDYRGNPEIDTTDIIYQENEFYTDMKVNIYRHHLRFNQSFSGRVTARRVGG